MSQPEDDPKAFAQSLARTLLAGNHSPKAIAAEFRTGDDTPVDISGFDAEQLEQFRGCRVKLTDHVARYLGSGDQYTKDTLDNAELALEKHYGLDDPWFITSRRTGDEASGSLQPVYFYLDRDG